MIILNNNHKATEDRFLHHMTSHDYWQSDIETIKKQENRIVVGSEEIIRHHGNRLICVKCERGAFRHIQKDMAKCPHCGWFGRSITVDEYITSKLYK